MQKRKRHCKFCLNQAEPLKKPLNLVCIKVYSFSLLTLYTITDYQIKGIGIPQVSRGHLYRRVVQSHVIIASLYLSGRNKQGQMPIRGDNRPTSNFQRMLGTQLQASLQSFSSKLQSTEELLIFEKKYVFVGEQLTGADTIEAIAFKKLRLCSDIQHFSILTMRNYLRLGLCNL